MATTQLDALTLAIQDFFLGKLGLTTSNAAFQLHFDPGPVSLPLSSFVGADNKFSLAASDEFVSKLGDKAAYIQNGQRFQSIEWLSQILKFNVFSKAVHYKQYDQSEALIKLDQKSFEAQLSEAKKRLETKLVTLGSLAETYAASSSTPRTWLDPVSVDAWATFEQTLLNDDDQNNAEPLRPKLEIPWRTLDPDEIKKRIERMGQLIPPKKWPLPGIHIDEVDNRPPWMTPIQPQWKDVDLSHLAEALHQSNSGKLFGLRLGTVNLNHNDVSDFEVNHDFNGESSKASFLKSPSAKARTSVVNPVAIVKKESLTYSDPQVTNLLTKSTDQSLTSLTSFFKNAIIQDAQITKTTGKKDKLYVSFKYQFVTIDRSWLFMPFFSSTNWFIPGAKRGSLSGDVGDGLGMLKMMAQKFIAVKDVIISADFNDEDVKSINSAFAIGPFGLGNKPDFQQGFLKIPGVQVIAYIDQALPLIPPRSAPSFVT